MLTKEAILAADDGTYEEIDIPEWGGTVRIRCMTGFERDRFESKVSSASNKTGGFLPNMRATLCAICLCNDAGERLFSDIEAVDLGKRSGSALDRVFARAMAINGMTGQDVEELAGNSVSDPSENSGSD